MSMLNISIVIPFYNTPLLLFMECLRSVKKLNPFEIILVDDCSTDEELVKVAKDSGCIYLKTPYQSGYDGLPFNLGVKMARGEYICRVDSDDVLLELPKKMVCDVHFGHLDRAKPPFDISIEELILAPRAIYNAMVAKRDIWLKYPLAKDAHVYGDVLFALQILHNQHKFTVHPKVNYIYRETQGSIQKSKHDFEHRLRHVQTIARFCQLENIEPQLSMHYLELGMMNVKYGSNSLQRYRKILALRQNNHDISI